MNARGSAAPQLTSLRRAGLFKLHALCDALGVSSDQRAAAVELFESVSFSWGNWQLHDTPSWPSDITDDGSPFEFSVAFERKRFELRLLFESQLPALTNRSSWEAGVGFCEHLRQAGRADLTLFDRVQDLFAPDALAPQASSQRFALWHAAVLRDQTCLYKVYFNPELDDPGHAGTRIDSALARLQLAPAQRFVDACLTAHSFTPRLPYFSIDLEHPDEARAKIYVAAESSTQAQAIVAASGGLDARTCSDWLAALTHDERPEKRPILICTAFRKGNSIPDVTVHVPVRCFSENDADAVQRLRSLLDPEQISRLSHVIEAVSGGPLDLTRGVLTYASMRRTTAGLRVTGYLAPQLYTEPSKATSGKHAVEPRSL